MSTEKSDLVLENQSHRSIVSEVDRSQRSEQQEWWMVEVLDGYPILSIHKGHSRFTFPGTHAVQIIVIKDAHNAALAAERQKNQELQHEIDRLNSR